MLEGVQAVFAKLKVLVLLGRKVREEIERRRRSGKPLAEEDDLAEVPADAVEPYDL